MKIIIKKFLLILLVVTIISSIFNFNNVSQAYTKEELRDKLDYIHWNSDIIDRDTWEFIENYDKYLGNTCHGYANAVSIALFNSNQNSNFNDWIITDNVEELCVGDLIRFRNGNYNHTMVVINIEGDTVYITDANEKGTNKIRWGNTYSKSQLTEMISETLAWIDWGSYNKGYFRHYKYNDIKTLTEETATISDLFINTVSTTEDTIKVRAIVPSVTKKVKFKIWRSGESSNSGRTVDGTYNSAAGCWEYTFKESDMKVMNNNLSCVEAIPYNSSGKAGTSSAVYNFVFGKRVSGLGNFTARIVMKSNTNYCIGTSGDNNGDDLKLKTKSQGDISQLWKFEEQSTGIYKITNEKNGKSIDVEGGTSVDDNGANMQLWSYVADASQHKYLIQSYNGGYRLVPTNTKQLKGIDIKDGKAENNNPIILYEAGSATNKAQTWVFEKVPTNISFNSTAETISVGGEKQLSVKLTPSDVIGDSNLVWSSSNTTVAVVDSGVVIGKSSGTATITVYHKDRTDLKATCKVTVSDNATGFSLDKSTYQINSLTERPKLEAKLSNGQKANVKWSSTNTNIATVDSNGVITPKRGGFVYIEATSEKFGKRKCWVYVSTIITLSDGSQAFAGDIDRNGVFDANDASMISDMFNNDDRSTDSLMIADLDGNGVINSIDVSISLDLYTSSFTIGRYTLIHSVYIGNTINIEKGKTEQLSLRVTPDYLIEDAKPTWKSNNTSVATVDSNGKVTAIAEGTAIITVKTQNGKNATCIVKVVKAGKLGDTDGNSKITTKDAKMVLQHIVKKIVLTPEQIKRADADKNGKITTKDAKMILQHIVKKIDLSKI